MNKTIKEVYYDYIKFLELKNKITTIRNIKYKFNCYILPYFGDFIINEIQEQDYINFTFKINKLGFSPSFNQQIFYIMKNFFNYLQIMYKIDNIPLRVGKVITVDKKTQDIKHNVWAKKEFKKFIKQVDEPIYHALFNLLFYTGLRKSEAMALKISDFNGKCILVNKSITKDLYDGEKLLLPTKNGKPRTIAIDFFLQLELRKLIKYYSKNFDNYNSEFFIFGGNKPISSTTLCRKKDYYCKKANVKRIRVHDFRHSHATMLYEKKVKIKTIQNRLGHSDVSTTLNTYVHLGEKEEKRLINLINLIRL